jgi:predicted glycosyltransferase
MKIWIDIKVPHEPLFFKTILAHIGEHKYHFSCRYSKEIIYLLSKYGFDFKVIGKRVEGNSIKRILGFLWRVLMLVLRVPKYDILLNHSSVWAIYASKLRLKKNITITDNEIDHTQNKHLFKHVDYLIVPDAIPKEILIKDNMNEKRIYQYHGFKEEIYIADYIPDKDFLKALPFDNFITIRPELLDTTYVPSGLTSIVPDLLKACEENKINVLYLSRYDNDKEYVSGFPNVYIPPIPLNGLDVCYYSSAVLTGSGTLGREAACMGIPAVTFFPGTELLAVDQKLIKNGWLFHSREVDKIIKYIKTTPKRQFDASRCRATKNDLIRVLKTIITEINNNN